MAPTLLWCLLVIPSAQTLEELPRGGAVVLDLDFPYYQERSPRSIAGEIAAHNWRNAFVYLTSAGRLSRDLVAAFHSQGIAVWLLVNGIGTWTNPSDLPEGWEVWQQQYADGKPDPKYTYFSHASRPFRDWMKRRVGSLLRMVPFDGVAIAETGYDILGSLPKDPRRYRDVSPIFTRAFQVETRSSLPPNFFDPNSPEYFAKNKKLYSAWVEFRVRLHVDLVNDLVNGAEGIRAVRPGIRILTFSYVWSDPGAEGILHEFAAEDPVTMILRVKPDGHVLQTHWRDWSRTDLPADYTLQYRRHLRPLREAFPGLPVFVQADVGSFAAAARSAAWEAEFLRVAERAGFAGGILYEYHLDERMLRVPPQIRLARREGEALVLIFTKRVDPASVAIGKNLKFKGSGRASGVRVDGNIVSLEILGIGPGTHTLQFEGIRDTPDRWYHQGAKANACPAGEVQFRW